MYRIAPNAEKVIGNKVYAFENHLASNQKCKKQFGFKWNKNFQVDLMEPLSVKTRKQLCSKATKMYYESFFEYQKGII